MKRYFRDDEHPWLKGLDFEELSAAALLDRVRARELSRADRSRPAAWVLDLDSTLFAVGTRIRGVLGEFLRAHERPSAVWHRLHAHLDPDQHRYDIERSFRDVFASWDSVSAARHASELWKEFEPYWRENFFSSRHIHRDEPYPGAVAWANEIARHGFEIVYLTGRERLPAVEGTLRALRANGFPMGLSTHVFLKPGHVESDVAFKQRALQTLRGRFEVVAFVDNEPENLVAAARELPRAEIAFFHTIMSARVPREDFQAYLGARRPVRLTSFA